MNKFHHCKLHPKENLGLENEQNQTKLKLAKFVANEMRFAEIDELSLVKNLFSANHAT